MNDSAGKSGWFTYDSLDPFKVRAQRAGREISVDPERMSYLKRFGTEPMEDTRGESVFLFRNGDHYLAHLIEGLGTKNLVADAMEKIVPEVTYYDSIAIDTVAMIVNDMITLGAFPISLAMYVAIGDQKWMHNERRIEALIEGWKQACLRSMCAWAGGETPLLRDVIMPECAELSGTAMGKTIGLTRFHAESVRPGDLIYFFGSSGIHANGLTDARTVASRLRNGYVTEVPGTGKNFGELLLTATHIYVNAIETMVRHGVRIRYGMNITGHGLCKLMRAPQSLTYVVEKLPRQNPVFDLIQEQTGFTDEKMYGKFNMGVGFAIIVAPSEKLVLDGLISKRNWPYPIFRAGHVESGEKRVVIEPKNGLVLDQLAIR